MENIINIQQNSIRFGMYWFFMSKLTILPFSYINIYSCDIDLCKNQSKQYCNKQLAMQAKSDTDINYLNNKNNETAQIS